MTGLHVASVQPAPTFDHGTSSMVASTPRAATGVAGAGVDEADDGVGLPDGSYDAVELVEHPATSSAANTATPT
jgi:hypothetical protein